MRAHIARRGALAAIALIVLIGTIAWTRMQDQPTPGTILLDVNPQGVAVDTRAGRAFIANTGLNNSGRTVSVLDSRTGQLIQTVTVGRSPSSVAVNEQTGRLFVANSGYQDGSGSHEGSIAVVDTRSGRVVRRTPTAGTPLFVTIDALTGRGIVTVYNTPAPGAVTVYEVDARSGQTLRTTTHYRAVLASDRRTGHTFVATGKDILMGDAHAGRAVRTILRGVDPLSEPGAAVVDEVTSRIFVADYARAQVNVIDTRTGALVGTIAVGAHPLRLSVDPRTARVFVLNQGYVNGADRPTGAGSVSMLDARTGAVLRTVPLDVNATAMTVDERRGRVLASTAGVTSAPENAPIHPGKVFVLDARSGTIQHVLPVGVAPYAIAEDARTGQAFVVNNRGNGGSYNPPSQWYLQWLPAHPPRGTVSVLAVR